MTSEPPTPYGAEPAPYGAPPPPAPGHYPPQYPYPYPPGPRTNTMAILAVVLAIVFAPAGIVLGHIARKQIRQTGEDGDGLALAGLVIGYVLTGLMVAFCVGYVAFFAILLGAMGTATAV